MIWFLLYGFTFRFFCVAPNPIWGDNVKERSMEGEKRMYGGLPMDTRTRANNKVFLLLGKNPTGNERVRTRGGCLALFTRKGDVGVQIILPQQAHN